MPVSRLGQLEERSCPKGVYVITSIWGNRGAGMTAAWVTRVAASPPAMLVAIHVGSFTGEIIKRSGWFVINILDKTQSMLALRFGRGSSRNRDKFNGLNLLTSLHGQPALKDALGYLECKIISIPEAGDHQLSIGEITEERKLREGSPLMYDPETLRRLIKGVEGG